MSVLDTTIYNTVLAVGTLPTLYMVATLAHIDRLRHLYVCRVGVSAPFLPIHLGGSPKDGCRGGALDTHTAHTIIHMHFCQFPLRLLHLTHTLVYWYSFIYISMAQVVLVPTTSFILKHSTVYHILYQTVCASYCIIPAITCHCAGMHVLSTCYRYTQYSTKHTRTPVCTIPAHFTQSHVYM